MESRDWSLVESLEDAEEKYSLVSALPPVLQKVNCEVVERFVTFSFIRFFKVLYPRYANYNRLNYFYFDNILCKTIIFFVSI